MKNLAKETRDTLKKNNISINDIVFINFDPNYEPYENSKGQRTMSWEEFILLAEDMNYDNGYGAQEIDPDLSIVLKNNAWFSRIEYDGAEEYIYNKTPEPIKE